MPCAPPAVAHAAALRRLVSASNWFAQRADRQLLNKRCSQAAAAALVPVLQAQRRCAAWHWGTNSDKLLPANVTASAHPVHVFAGAQALRCLALAFTPASKDMGSSLPTNGPSNPMHTTQITKPAAACHVCALCRRTGAALPCPGVQACQQGHGQLPADSCCLKPQIYDPNLTSANNCVSRASLAAAQMLRCLYHLLKTCRMHCLCFCRRAGAALPGAGLQASQQAHGQLPQPA